jgi:hypothetical protein
VAAPTVQSRLTRRLVLVACDAAVVEHLRQALPEGWEIVVTAEIDTLGGFAELLQYRFMLVDLDDATFDSVAIIRAVRTRLMLNLAIICFGGTLAVRDAARLARADRFLSRDEITEQLPAFCEQFGWGG